MPVDDEARVWTGRPMGRRRNLPLPHPVLDLRLGHCQQTPAPAFPPPLPPSPIPLSPSPITGGGRPRCAAGSRQLLSAHVATGLASLHRHRVAPAVAAAVGRGARRVAAFVARPVAPSPQTPSRLAQPTRGGGAALCGVGPTPPPKGSPPPSSPIFLRLIDLCFVRG